jgi:predicted RND superfamily exporter protein
LRNESVRGRIEVAFASWGGFVIRWRWPAIVATLLVTLALGSLIPRLEVDNSEEAFLHGNDPERIRYDRFRSQFDRDDRVLVVVHPPEIFDFDFLERLRAFHRDIEESVPYVEEVTSLINARNTRGDGDQLIVEDLLERWPQGEADLQALRARVLGNPLYRNILISENGRYTTVVLKPFTYSTLGSADDALAGFEDAPGASAAGAAAAYLTEQEAHELVEALRQVVDRHRSPDFELYVVGGPAFDVALTETMQRDATVFMLLSLLVTCAMLLILFRRPSGLLLPISVVSAAVVSSIGVMVLLGVPFSITFNMLPAFLVVVGVCDSVHILVLVYQRLEEGQARDAAISQALGHSGLAVVMTSVTTACGLLSFSIADIAPIAQLGVVAPIGVMLAMVYTLVLLPALLAVFPIRARARRRGAFRSAALGRFLTALGDLATDHPLRVLAVTALVLVVASGGLLKIRFSHNALRWFPEDDPLRVASSLVDAEFKGASTVEVLVHTGSENGLHDPDTLSRIERAMRYSESLEVADLPVNKAVSIVDVVKEINQALNENRPKFYVLPRERPLVAQELLLFENSGSDDLEDVTDARFETGRMTIRTPWVDAMLYPDFLDQLDRSLRAILGESITFELTGSAVLFTRVFKGVNVSLARSYVFAFAVIAPMLVLLIGDLRRGLLAVIPNLIPIYLVLGLMGWADIPIDVSTLLIGGIVLGLAVDDTIHFMHKFSRYYEDTGDARWAVHETLATTGAALLFTSLILVFGFAVFLAAYFNSGRWFGLLTSFATAVAFLADVIVGPALMILVTRSGGRSGTTGRAGRLVETPENGGVG